MDSGYAGSRCRYKIRKVSVQKRKKGRKEMQERYESSWWVWFIEMENCHPKEGKPLREGSKRQREPLLAFQGSVIGCLWTFLSVQLS